MSRKRAVRLLLIPVALGLMACSPEAERTQGGGLGGDPGNRDSLVEMHKGAEPYHETVQAIPTPWGMDRDH